MNTTEGQFQLRDVDASVAVHVNGLHEPLHVPGWEVSDVGLLERRLELVGVDVTRLVKVDGIEEAEDGLAAVSQVVGEHQEFLGVFLVVAVVVVVVVEVMVGVMHFVDDRTAGHEEHALGHGVVEQVEERCTKGHDDNAVVDVVVGVHRAVREVLVPVQRVGEVERRTQSGEDVGELGHRRVGEDLLEVVLNKGDGRRHDRRGSADGGDDEGQVGQLSVKRISTEEREHAGHEVQTSVDHRCGVDEGRNGRWPFHGVGQPNVKRELSGLAHRTDEHQAERPSEHAGVVGGHLLNVAFVEHHGVVECTLVSAGIGVEQRPQDGQTDHEEHVANTGGQEGLLGSIGSAGAFVVEADEEIGTQTHQFPENEQPEERISEHHPEHPRTEEHELSIEAVVAVVVDGIGVHVADGKSVDEQAQEGGNEQQHHGDVVDVNAEPERNFSDGGLA